MFGVVDGAFTSYVCRLGLVDEVDNRFEWEFVCGVFCVCVFFGRGENGAGLVL